MFEEEGSGIDRGQRYRLKKGVKIWAYDIYGFSSEGI